MENNMEKDFKYSKSEKRGIKQLNSKMKKILSIGISTGGSAEISMAKKCPNAKIIATTIDEKGFNFSKEKIANPKDMEMYYPKEEQDKYGVVGIELKLIKK